MKIDRWGVYKKYDGHCAYCGKKITFKEFQVDHIDPDYTKNRNRENNLNPCCKECNIWKCNYQIEVYREKVKDLETYLVKRLAFKVGKNYGVLEFKKWDERFYFEKGIGI